MLCRAIPDAKPAAPSRGVLLRERRFGAGRAFASVAVVAIALLSTPADAQVRTWVDENGVVHIEGDGTILTSTTVGDASAYTYRWLDDTGQMHLTFAPPPIGARLLEKTPHSKDAPRFEGAKVARALPRANVRQQLIDLRTTSSGAPLPRIVGETAARTQFDSLSLRGRSVWIAFATTTCGHCAIEAKQMRKLESELEEHETFYIVVEGGHKEAVLFSERTGFAPDRVVALAADVFPTGSVPFNVIVDDTSAVVRAFTGRMRERSFRAYAQRVLR